MAGVKIGLSGDWRRAARLLLVAPIRIRVAIDRAVMQEAQYFRTRVIEGFREQAPGGQKFAPLAETTLAIRRFKGFSGTKALLVRGDLRNSIKVTKKTTALGAEAFIGVHRTAKNKSGKSLVNIAEVHEFGSRPIVIEVTPAMRKFLMMAFTKELGGRTSESESGEGGLSTGIIIVQIPARPFLQPVIDKYFNSVDARLRFQSRVMVNLNGMMGVMGGVPGVPGSGGSRGRSLFSTVGQAIARSRRGLGRDPTTGRYISVSSD